MDHGKASAVVNPTLSCRPISRLLWELIIVVVVVVVVVIIIMNVTAIINTVTDFSLSSY